MKKDEEGKAEATIASLFAVLEDSNTRDTKEIKETSPKPLLTLLDRRSQLRQFTNLIRSQTFQRNHARRLFTPLLPILQKIIDDEKHVPQSAYHDNSDDNDDGGNDFPLSKRQIDTNIEIKPDLASSEALRFMKYCALFLRAYLSNLKERRHEKNRKTCKMHSILEEVWNVAELLHDALFSLNSCGIEGMAVQRTISSVCEEYWHGQFTDREMLVTQLVPLLVLKSLDGNAIKADIKRLWDIRDALSLLDFQDETISYLRNLLLRTISSPLYLKNVEGRKLISFLFQLDDSDTAAFIQDLHLAVRDHVPLANKATLEAYGDIYYRAWKCFQLKRALSSDYPETIEAEESNELDRIQKSFEENVFQNLMYSVLHVSAPMAKSIRIILQALHERKKEPEIDQLLYKMYGPLLWRALAAANPSVRINASYILSATFPLHDPTIPGTPGKKHLKDMVQKSVESLMSLLQDSNPKVRVASSSATVQILGVYWDALPIKYIRSLLNAIVMQHASDASSALVRAQSINGITFLLEVPASHGVLRPLLPYIGNLIHDVTERVRLAVVKMLITIKSLKNIKFYHIVPYEQILVRLSVDGEGDRCDIEGNSTGPIPRAITKLLLNSYFPQGPNVRGSNQVERTLLFLSNHLEAAMIFYANLSSHLSVNSVSKLMVMLVKVLNLGVEREIKEMAAKTSKEYQDKCVNDINDCSIHNDEGSVAVNEIEKGWNLMEVHASNTSLMARVIETICCLWKSIREELDRKDNIECKEFLEEAFGGRTLTDLYSHFAAKILEENIKKSDEDVMLNGDCQKICRSILCCAGYFSPDAIVGLSSYVSSQMASNGMMDQENTDFSPHFNFFCMQGLHREAFLSLSCSIASIFGGEGIIDNAIDKVEFGQKMRIKRKKRSIVNPPVHEVTRIIPELPKKAAIDVLARIIGGNDPSCIAAREILLASESSCILIENALVKATITAEKLLSCTNTEFGNYKKEIYLVLTACETYGRLAIHKQASKEDSLQFSSEAHTLLSWISNRILPAVTALVEEDDTSSSFGDLNLSRISGVDSLCSTLSTPLSPFPNAPLRRQSHVSSTSVKLDNSFDSMEKNGGKLFTLESVSSPCIYAQALGISLIRSALCIFTEWLLVGGLGLKEIFDHASKWVQIVKCECKSIYVQSEFMPAFCRLSLVFGKLSGKYLYLKEIIRCCDNLKLKSEAGRVLKKTIVFVLSLRGAESRKHIQEFICSIVNIIDELGSESIDEESNESMDATLVLANIIPQGKKGLVLAITCMLNSGPGIIALTAELVERLTSTKVEKNMSTISIGANLLQYACENIPGGPYSAKVKENIRNISVESTNKKRDEQFFRKMLDIAA